MDKTLIPANQMSETEQELKANSTINMPKHLQKPRLRRWEASEYMELAHGLTVAPATLAKLASIGGGRLSPGGSYTVVPSRLTRSLGD